MTYVYEEDLTRLKRQRNVEPMVIVQGVGDVVVIPACLPHQVSLAKIFNKEVKFPVYEIIKVLLLKPNGDTKNLLQNLFKY